MARVVLTSLVWLGVAPPASAQAGAAPRSLAERFDRHWALVPNASDRETCHFGLCAHRANYLGARHTDDANAVPTSPSPDHTPVAPVSHRTYEGMYQISLKSMLGSLRGDRLRFWFAYTQQSHWQVFDEANSRPFRNTDYEPELFVNHRFDGLGTLRFIGAGAAHQSNGQSKPLSRSWNRVYLQAGWADDDWTLLARVSKRWREKADNDDNPDLQDYIGRAEAALSKRLPTGQIARVQLRHSLKASAARGSAALELLQPLAGPAHVFARVFTGYGESLIDYNHRQTAVTVGLTVMEFGL